MWTQFGDNGTYFRLSDVNITSILQVSSLHFVRHIHKTYSLFNIIDMIYHVVLSKYYCVFFSFSRSRLDAIKNVSTIPNGYRIHTRLNAQATECLKCLCVTFFLYVYILFGVQTVNNYFPLTWFAPNFPYDDCVLEIRLL